MADSPGTDAAVVAERVRRVRNRLGLNQEQFAALFGVHPITVSKWENGHAVPDAAQLGTLDLAEHALQADEGVGTKVAQAISRSPRWAPLGELHHAVGSLGGSPALWGITSADLHRWAATTIARPRLPELMRRLVLATDPSALEVDFPAGDTTAFGYDGRTLAQRERWPIPAGRAVWELSTEAMVRSKAQRDIRKRAKSPDVLRPAEVTYIGVSPNSWDSKRNSLGAWQDEWAEQGPFAEVRFYDSTTLETWLSRCPAVSAWLATVLGKASARCHTPQQFLDELLTGGNVPLGPSVLLAGRQQQADRIRSWLGGEACPVHVQADSADEALAFVAAVVATSSKPERQAWEARSLVVDDRQTWQRLVASYDGPSLLLLPRFGDTEKARPQLGTGHYVALPCEPGDLVPADVLHLPPLDRDDLAARLTWPPTSLPVDEAGRSGRATELAREAEGSFGRLREAVGLHAPAPAWVRDRPSVELIALLLVGSWAPDNEADTAIIERVAGVPADRVRALCAELQRVRNPPIRFRGGTWLWRSRLQCWRWLAPSLDLSSDTAHRFLRACVEVLGREDPALALPTEDRWTAAIHGAVLPHSKALRKGMAESLVLLATHGSGPGKAVSRQSEVDRVISELLGPDWTTWASADDILVTLAEASPNGFLTALSASIDHGKSGVLRVFEESHGPMFGPSYHPSLLWALEALAWSPRRFARVVAVLTALCGLAIDVNGNSPWSSLISLFRWWKPQTTATHADRVAALRTVERSDAHVWWKLLLALLPESHMSGMYSHQFRWRDQGELVPQPVLREQTREFLLAVNESLVKAAEDDERRAELVGSFSRLDSAWRDQLLDSLEQSARGSVPPDAAAMLRDACRSLLSDDATWPDSTWGLTNEQRTRFERLLGVLVPADTAQRHSWLFRHSVALPEGQPGRVDNWYERVDSLREEAIRDVLSAPGPGAALHGLLCAAELPGLAAWTLGKVGAPDELEARLLRPESDEDPWAQVPRMYARGALVRLGEAGRDWLKTRVSEFADEGRISGVVELLLSEARPERGLWAWVEGFGDEVRRLYWARIPPYPVLVNLPDRLTVEYAVRALLSVGRPVESCEVAGFGPRKKRKEDPLPGRLLLELLLAAGRDLLSAPDGHPRAGRIRHSLGDLVDEAQASGELSSEECVDLELLLFPLLNRRRTPVHIHQRLETDPGFVVELLCALYRADDEPRGTDNRPGDEGEPADEGLTTDAPRAESLALFAYHLLESWKQVPGGLSDKGRPADEAVLRAWFDAVRAAAREQGRRATTELFLGRVLARAGSGADGAWPCGLARELLERRDSEYLKRGMILGRSGMRGVWSRGLTDGGGQERGLADELRDDAIVVGAAYPTTVQMLHLLAEQYDLDARRFDREAEQWKDP